MPKDYAKRVNQNKAKKKAKRSQTRPKQPSNKGNYTHYWLMFGGVVILGALGVTAELMWWPNMSRQSSSSHSVPVKTRQPDYQRASASSQQSLPVEVHVNHQSSGFKGYSCQHRQIGVLTLGKLSNMQQETVRHLLSTHHSSWHLHSLTSASSWQIGPHSIDKLHQFQKDLYKNHIYSVINCQP